jgi:hypothetical protein
MKRKRDGTGTGGVLKAKTCSNVTSQGLLDDFPTRKDFRAREPGIGALILLERALSILIEFYRRASVDINHPIFLAR